MLQLLIQPPSPTGRPGAGTGLPAPPASARREAAGMLGRTLREVLAVRQQPLSVLLRYLLLVLAQHKKDPMPALARPASGGPAGAGRGGGSSGTAAGAAAASGAGTSSSGGGPDAQPTAVPLEAAAAAAAAGNEEEDLDADCRRLLLAWRDPMPLPRDAMHGGPARFPEVQVQVSHCRGMPVLRLAGVCGLHAVPSCCECLVRALSRSQRHVWAIPSVHMHSPTCPPSLDLAQSQPSSPSIRCTGTGIEDSAGRGFLLQFPCFTPTLRYALTN